MKRDVQVQLRPALLAVALATATLGVVLWLAAPGQVALADDSSLSDAMKTVSPSIVQPGDIVTYTIVLSNSNPVSEVNVLVTDPLHPLLSYLSGSARTTPEDAGTLTIGDGITWTVTVSPAMAFSLTFQAEVDVGAAEATVITNTATISSGGSSIQQSAAVTVDSPPTSQIWSPDTDAIITQQAPLTIDGYAWDYGAVPPFVVGVPVLSTQRVGDRSYYLDWTSVVSADQYVVHEANTPDFDAFTSLGPTSDTDMLISKGTGEDGTYYYRVQGVGLGLDPSRWSNVESVVVPWTPTAMNSSSSALRGMLNGGGQVTVEVRIDSGPWYTVPVTPASWEGGWSWSYDWPDMPAEQNVQHVVQTRAIDAVGNVSAVDAVTVTLDNASYSIFLPLVARRWPPVPYAPTLHDIVNTDGDGDYTVSWTYEGDPPADATSYTLQEATDGNFTSPYTYPDTSNTSQEVTGKGTGTYYYRVRGNNSYGAGEWSNVVSVQVAGFFDDFSSTSTGWPQKTYNRGSDPDGPVMEVGYTSGTYRMKILLETSGLNNKRMGTVPSPYVNTFSNYDVEVSHYFAQASDQIVAPTWGKAGLIFGASSDFSTIYVVEWHYPLGTDTPQCAVYKYDQVDLPTTIVWQAGGTPVWDWAACSLIKSGYNQTNHIRVEVRGSSATVYINSTRLGSFSDSNLSGARRVGLVTGSWERTPVESRFDNFRVTSK